MLLAELAGLTAVDVLAGWLAGALHSFGSQQAARRPNEGQVAVGPHERTHMHKGTQTDNRRLLQAHNKLPFVCNSPPAPPENIHKIVSSRSRRWLGRWSGGISRAGLLPHWLPGWRPRPHSHSSDCGFSVLMALVVVVVVVVAQHGEDLLARRVSGPT